MLIYICMGLYMGSTTISLDEEAYSRLKSLKKTNESFSDVVKRLVMPNKKKSLLDFAGIWKLNEKEMKKLKQAIQELEDEFDNLFGY